MSDTDNDGCGGCVLLTIFLIGSYLIISAIGLEGYVILIVIVVSLYIIFRPRETSSKTKYVPKKTSSNPGSANKDYFGYNNEKNSVQTINESVQYNAHPPHVQCLPEDLIVALDSENRESYIEAVNRLIEILHDSEEAYYRSMAASYLGETEDTIAVRALIDAKDDPDENVRESAARALKKIKNAQKDLIKNYETLICENDFFRPYKIYLSEGKFVECRVCGHSKFLQSGVEEVIGFIGDQKYPQRDGKRLFVDLWDQENKKAKNADIDALWIIQSENIDYGWAISAVVQTLKNDITRQKELNEIPVTIKGTPEIPDEEAEILEELFAEIRFEI
ncbi:HEAT repeat domain-containing protein [Methanothermobacter sp. K4]|uniref:HEAT repeat domain-containing protein n=1 Tax=Methanothermobacter sp. K4 TaxID=2913262 RepID=UPI001EDB91DB|nr:HEAT repeat domain-containing protein [Methanothermobacter sp. K4]MCG2829197.1 HEAT repeat domain-containing protein [Methanothermobacter sp. K4]